MCQTDSQDSVQSNKIINLKQQLDWAIEHNDRNEKVIQQLNATCCDLQSQLSLPKVNRGNQTQQTNHLEEVQNFYKLFQIDLMITQDFINLDQARQYKQLLFQKVAAKALDQSISGQLNQLQAENRKLKLQITDLTQQFVLRQKSCKEVMTVQLYQLRKQICAIKTQLVGSQGEFELVGQSIQSWGDQLTQQWIRRQTDLYQENADIITAYSQQQQSFQQAEQMQNNKLESQTKQSESIIAELRQLNADLSAKILAAGVREQQLTQSNEDIRQQNQALSQKIQWLLSQQQCGSPESGLESTNNLEEGSQLLTLQEALILLQTKTKEWQHMVQRNFDLEKIIDEKDEEILEMMKIQYPPDQPSVQSPDKLATIAEETSLMEQTQFSIKDQSLDIGWLPPVLSRVQSLLSPEITDNLSQLATPTNRRTMPMRDFDRAMLVSESSSENVQTFDIPHVDRKKLLLDNIFSKLKSSNKTDLPQSPISGVESHQIGTDLEKQQVSGQESSSSDSFFGSGAAHQVGIVLQALERFNSRSQVEQVFSELGSVKTVEKSSLTESQEERFADVQVKVDFWQEVTVEDVVDIKQHTTLEEIYLVAKPSKARTMPNLQPVTMIEDPFAHGEADSVNGTASFQEDLVLIESVAVEVQSAYFTQNPVILTDATYGDTADAEFALRQKLKNQFGDDFFQDEKNLMSFAQPDSRKSGNSQIIRNSGIRGSLAFFSERMDSFKMVDAKDEYTEVIVENKSQESNSENSIFSYIEGGGSIILNNSIILSQGNTSI